MHGAVKVKVKTILLTGRKPSYYEQQENIKEPSFFNQTMHQKVKSGCLAICQNNTKRYFKN